MIEVRTESLQNNDVHSVFIELMQMYAADIMGGGEKIPKAITDKLIPELIKRDDHILIFAYVDDVAVGFANCFEGFSTFKAKPLLNIHDFAVRPEYRGQGVANHMLNYIEILAKERGYCKLTLEVLENNLIAKGVYSKFGFYSYELDSEAGKAEFWEKTLV